jgi:type III secretion system YscJ/HrcJ family lipoprotein
MRAFLSLITLAMLIVGCKDQEIILEELSQNEANEILVALWDNHIEASKKAHIHRKSLNYSINVPKKDAHQALRILVINQLPSLIRSGLKDIYTASSSSIIPTKSDESARLTLALQGEIEALIKTLPQVADAHVVLSLEHTNELSHSAHPKSASLTLTYRPDPHDDTPPFNEQELQNLVSSAIGGLPASSVNVIMKALKPVQFLRPHEFTQPLKNAGSPKALIYSLFSLVILTFFTALYAMLRPKFKLWIKSSYEK